MIRSGTVVDLDQITVVRTSVRENHLSVEQLAERGITQASIAKQMQSGELGCWVAEARGKVIGFSMAHRDTANIFALFVLPEYEGRGYGSALMRECEVWLKALGHAEAHLETDRNSRAVKFYCLQGWMESEDLINHPHEKFFRKEL